MKRRIAVRGIFVYKGKLLCVKLKPYKNNDPVDFWCLVGGGIDPGEQLVNALKREIIEETGVEPVVGRLLYVQQYMKSDDKEEMEFFFEITNAKSYIKIDLAKSSHGIDEIERIEYIDPSKEEHKVLPEFLRTIDLENLPQTTVFYDYL